METKLVAGAITADDEREALLVAYAELLASVGHDEVSDELVIERAGVAPEVFAEHFEDLEACAIAAFDLAAARTFTACADSFVATTGDYADACLAALRTLLAFVAAVPAFIHLATVGLPPGETLQRHRQEAMSQFAEFLRPGYLMTGREPPPQDELVSQMIGGGILELFRLHVLQERIEELPAALPALVHVVFSLLFGTDAARRALEGLEP
jgi:AcrR family transcriptional regulator